MKIVCDTNVLVSGVLFGGHARQILRWASRGRLTNYTSDDLLLEAQDVFSRPKFKLTPRQVAAFDTLFRDTFELVHPSTHHVVIAADPDDDLVLDAAATAGAEVIVSGDRHLLDLKAWQGIRILSPAELVAELSD